MKNLDYYLSLNYRKTLYRDEDGDWVVEVNDLPGCAADGKTSGEALQNLDSAMRSWIESRLAAGLDVPEPRENGGYSGRILLRMPRSLHQRLASQAQNESVSLNQYLVTLLADGSSLRNWAPSTSLGNQKIAGVGIGGTLDPVTGSFDLICMHDFWGQNAETADSWRRMNDWRGSFGLRASNFFLGSGCSLIPTLRAPWCANLDDVIEGHGIQNSAPGDQPNLKYPAKTGVRKGIA
jgi:antitoxin HicB